MVAPPLQRRSVKGRQGEFVVYELLGVAGSVDPELKADERDLVRCRMTTMAMACFTDGRVADARDRYEELLAEFPDEKVARLMRDVLGRRVGVS